MRIKRRCNEPKRDGIRIRGRQILLLLYGEFTLTSTEQQSYSLTDLINLKGPKANDIESFLSSWFFVLGNFNDLPADDVLTAMPHSKREHLTSVLDAEGL